MIEQTGVLVGIAASLVVVLGAVFGWLRWVQPKIRHGLARGGAALDTVVGREAIVDNITGRELAPALPSIGKRMESMEGTVSRLVEVIEGQHQQDKRLDDHERRLKQLEDGTIERIAAKAESVSAWRAVEAVAKSTPPDEIEGD